MSGKDHIMHVIFKISAD